MEINNRTLIWVVIGILLLAVIYVTFFKGEATGIVTGDKIDTTGWTENEIMNYEMHGTIPARLGASTSGNGMVGGC